MSSFIHVFLDQLTILHWMLLSYFSLSRKQENDPICPLAAQCRQEVNIRVSLHFCLHLCTSLFCCYSFSPLERFILSPEHAVYKCVCLWDFMNKENNLNWQFLGSSKPRTCGLTMVFFFIICKSVYIKISASI